LLRAYPPIADRQQGADRLVYNEDDLRSVLGEALTDGSVSTIRLGADITPTRSFVLSGNYGVTIDGGSRYGFVAAATVTLTEFFTVAAGVTVEGIAFRGCGFTAFPDLIIRCADATSTLRRVDFHDCYADFVHDFVLGDGGAPTWADSVVEGCTFLLQRGSTFITPGFGQAVLQRCTLQRSNCVDLTGGVYATHVDNAAGSDGNTYIGVTAISALGASDVYLAATSAEENVLARPLVVGTYPSSLSSIDFTTVQGRNGCNEFTVQGTGTTSGAVSITITQFTPAPSKSYLITMRTIGRRTNGTDPGQTDTWIIQQMFKVSSTGVVTTGATLTNNSTLDDATWAAAIDSALGNIRMRAAGAAGQNISWACTAIVDEV